MEGPHGSAVGPFWRVCWGRDVVLLKLKCLAWGAWSKIAVF